MEKRKERKRDADSIIYWDIKCEWLSLSKQTKTHFIFHCFFCVRLLKSSVEREENMTFISAAVTDKIFSSLLFTALPNTDGHSLGLLLSQSGAKFDDEVRIVLFSTLCVTQKIAPTVYFKQQYLRFFCSFSVFKGRAFSIWIEHWPLPFIRHPVDEPMAITSGTGCPTIRIYFICFFGGDSKYL